MNTLNMVSNIVIWLHYLLKEVSTIKETKLQKIWEKVLITNTARMKKGERSANSSSDRKTNREKVRKNEQKEVILCVSEPMAEPVNNLKKLKASKRSPLHSTLDSTTIQTLDTLKISF